MTTLNQVQGKSLLMEISTDAGLTWKLIGGFNTKGYNLDNPVTDVTSQSTDSGSNYTESAINGYGTMTMNGSGFLDKRTDATRMASGEFIQIGHGTVKCALLRFSDTIAQYSGVFNITGLEQGAGTNDIATFSATFQNQGDVTITIL